LEIVKQPFHWLAGAGQSLKPPSGSMVLHGGPWSGGVPASLLAVMHAVLQFEPDGPWPAVEAGCTQQTCPLGQSLALVQATHWSEAQIFMSAGVHRLSVGQQTYG
jgi:hypothetical protein